MNNLGYLFNCGENVNHPTAKAGGFPRRDDAEMKTIKSVLDFVNDTEIINKYNISEIFLKCFIYQDTELAKTTSVTIYPDFKIRNLNISKIKRFSNSVYEIVYLVVIKTLYTKNLESLLSEKFRYTRNDMYSKTYIDTGEEIVIEFTKRINKAYF